MTARTPGDRGDGAGPPVEVADLSYASAGAELDAIIQEFETGVVDVDRLVGQLERATDIVDELDRRLRGTRMRVEELVPRLEAIGRDESPDGGSEQDDSLEEDEPPVDDSGSPGLF